MKVHKEQNRGTRDVAIVKVKQVWRTRKTKKHPDVTSEQLEDVVNQNFGFISFRHE
jgi:hypothetical protein